MRTFIQLEQSDRKNLFECLKKECRSLEYFYPSLNISRTMFFNYLSGRYNIPEDIFIELEKKAKIKINSFKKIKKEKYLKKEIELPRLDLSLAEVIGILNGDGHISNINHEICVIGNILEREYLNYLKKLLETTFSLEFKIIEEPTRFKIRTYSKKIVDFLHNKYELPKGNKLGSLHIPKEIFKSRSLLICYIRGLFDTDGSFYLRRKKDPVVDITSADHKFLKQIQQALISLGFNAGISKKKTYIYNKRDIEKFFRIISPANSKHLKKYQNYLNHALVV